MSPVISVIIPHYTKNDCYLEECLNSFIAQTYSDFELLLIDNGAVPSSLAKRLCKSDSRFIYVYKKGAGMCGGRNIGTKMANGKYVCYCDSDDYVKKDYLLELVSLKERFGTQISQVPFTRLISDGRELRFPFDFDCARYVKSFDDITLFNEPLPPCGVLLDRELALKNPFDEEHALISEDAHWSFRILLHTRKLAFAERHLYVYRDSLGSVSKTKFALETIDQRASSEQWRYENQIELLEKERGIKLEARCYEFFGNAMIALLFYYSRNKRRPPDQWKRECRLFMAKNKKHLKHGYYVKFCFAFKFPYLSILLFRILKHF